MDYTYKDLGFYPSEIYIYCRNKKKIRAEHKTYAKVNGKWKLIGTESKLMTGNEYLSTVSKHWDSRGTPTRRSMGHSHYGFICKEMTVYNIDKTMKSIWKFTTIQ